MTADRHAHTAEHAYYIWEKEGRPHGRAFDHWLRAEAELVFVTMLEEATPPAPASVPVAKARKSAPKRSSRRNKTEKG
jgi:hypothetical protein